MDVFLLASSFFKVDDAVVAGVWEEGLVGIGDWGLVVVVVVVREEGIIGGVR